MSSIDCPYCDGQGYVLSVIHDFEALTCPVCGGSKRLPVAKPIEQKTTAAKGYERLNKPRDRRRPK